MRGISWGAAIAGIVVTVAWPSIAEAAMPRKFTVACEAGRFGHGRTEVAARADLAANAERGPEYRDTYEFDLDARQTKMSWAGGKRTQTRTMTALTADIIEIYNYHLLTITSARTFDFRTMINTSVTHFTSTDPEYAWAVTEQPCALAR
jgi:hypothetical protein